MSEEKIYLIKNDHGEYLTVERTATWWNSPVGTTVRNIDVALAWAEKYGGHVVTLVEEPEKVVLTKEQAEIVEGAHSGKFPAASIVFYGDDDEEPLMNAYVNGYTVAKEKKYLLPMDGTLEEGDDNDNFQLYAYCYKGRWLVDEVETDPSYKHQTVTQKELETAP
ncbi:DUF1642 domain-containing protein, partial [Lacticaseibacillus rhamnosus]|uniref:DUF1642 domain-containing protein n=1 Tax=Lacticaseibacillus rhamnosus TaxID=47715 RepID=UPI001950A169